MITISFQYFSKKLNVWTNQEIEFHSFEKARRFYWMCKKSKYYYITLIACDSPEDNEYFAYHGLN